ncbi:pyridoxamine 5'-phosphate oxidase family protein [Sphaerisporangium perillae]|uniref:pyridoxamine 5'-phosphate oxidase family protein n=1 Tax=Sphaerisporangium perillae TaxID=2935860 RepID=UPI00200C6E56|nr:pyridoxamine 5'-phosphate oxidase family protein [Sphaerisporangium perillae]
MEHPGELLLQRRAGITKPLGSARTRAVIPDVAADFLRAQRMLVIASPDRRGRVWATALTGPEGFADPLDERHIAIDALPAGPVAGLYDGGDDEDGRDIGIIAIEPATRRRMRANGRAHREGDRLIVRTEQVYSNCPKYIQKREPAFGSTGSATRISTGQALTPAQRDWIRAADTFFIATHVDGQGSDASHRGGAPGFVQVIDERRLAWPEYPGNLMFMTLGNLLLNPSCGLLFLDWESGRGLRLTGRAAFDGDEAGFELEEVVEMAGEIPSPWRFVERSPFNPPVAAPEGSSSSRTTDA